MRAGNSREPANAYPVSGRYLVAHFRGCAGTAGFDDQLTLDTAEFHGDVLALR